jgi:predicted nucleotidyltransferase
MADAAVVGAVQNYLRELGNKGIEAPFGILFGSHATGKADAWSDIDLVVISPRFDGAYSREDVHLLWRVAARADSRMEPVPCGVRQWAEDDSSVLIEIARREGEKIPVA